MPTYVYETIPDDPATEPARFEIKQAMAEDALTVHPETGEPVKRIILGGFGVMEKAMRLRRDQHEGLPAGVVAPNLNAPRIIEKKRDGAILSDGDIRDFIAAYTDGVVPDYQMSAFAMAVYFQGMTMEETAALTTAMLQSGGQFSWPDSAPDIVDKHSTGGIGDKTSLVLAPLLACCGVWVPMISGRGLGITGGTLDKLESIPGYRVDLSEEEITEQLHSVGAVITGQTANLCPADKKLYALRDVSGTVPSQPLIVASIMSKKLAEGLDRLVLDVKFGRGAFMKTREDAESLGNAMVEVGNAMGVQTRFVLNPMNQPLGRTVGNALEVAESVACLRGEGPSDLRKLVLDLSRALVDTEPNQLEAFLDDGTAYQKFASMVEAQGGEASSLTHICQSTQVAPVIKDFTASQFGHTGRVLDANAEILGVAAMELGAGRQRADDSINHTVGFSQLAQEGDELEGEDLLCRVHANSEEAADTAIAQLNSAFTIES